MLFWDIIAAHPEIHVKPINTLCGQTTVTDVKAGGTYKLPLWFKELMHLNKETKDNCCPFTLIYLYFCLFMVNLKILSVAQTI
jgi:hypothetical protein